MNDPALQFTVFGAAARLANPRALWLFLVVLLVGSIGAYALWRRRLLLREAAGQLGARVAPGANAVRPAVRLGLQILGLMLLAFALASPQCGTRTELTKRYGIDLVVAFDASRSMLARDILPDRLSRAKLELSALIDTLAGDRIGIVVFAEEAFIQCPLTTDYAAAKTFLRAIGPDSIPQQGTSIENALRASGEVLAAAERGSRSKVILLLTDGEDHEQGALEAADELAAHGIRVFAIGVGSAEGALIPIVDEQGNITSYKQNRNGEPVMTKLDARLLQEIAERTQGKVFYTGVADFGLGPLRAELDRLEKSELEGRSSVTYEDRYAFAAFPAFLLLLGSLLMREGRPHRAVRSSLKENA